MSAIDRVAARQILDSRGNPTVEVDVVLESGALGRAAVPSGASTGEHEAVELRDGDRRTYLGKGVLEAVGNVVTVLGPGREGPRRERSGCARPAPDRARRHAEQERARRERSARRVARRGQGGRGRRRRVPLPLARRRGGSRASRADDERRQRRRARGRTHSTSRSSWSCRRGAASFAEALQIGAEVFHTLKGVLHERGLATAVGDEGGFAPDLGSSEEAIEVILAAAERAGHANADRDRARPGGDGVLARRRVPLRGAREGPSRDGGVLDRARAARYPIVSIEDGLAEDDWASWRELTERLGDRLQLVGDDLFVTNVDRLRRGHRARASPTRSSSRSTRSARSPRRSTRSQLARACRLRVGHLAPLRRDRGHDDRRPRRRDERRPDQDRRAVPVGPRSEVQPAAAHRGRARRREPSIPAGTRSRAFTR